MTRLAGIVFSSCCFLFAAASTADAQPTGGPQIGTFDGPDLDRFDHSLIQRDLDLLLQQPKRVAPKHRQKRRPAAPFRPNFATGSGNVGKPSRRPSATRKPNRRPVVVHRPRKPTDPRKPQVTDRPRPAIVVRVPQGPVYLPPPTPRRPPAVATWTVPLPLPVPPRGPVTATQPPIPQAAPSAPSAAPAVVSSRYRPREVLVALPGEATGRFLEEISRTYDIEPRDSLGISLLGVRIYRFSIRGARTVPQVVADIQGDPRVGDVQPNYVSELQDDAAATQATAVQYSLASLHVPDALEHATGRNVTIAVIDSGIDADHPELAGVISATFDAVGDPAAASGPHGTAIAGIIGARKTLRGVSPGAQVMAVRAFAVTSDGGTGETDSLTLARAMDWAASHRAAIFNMSFAGPRDPLLERLLDAAHDKGIILVAAAGNGGPDSPPVWPAAHRDVIAVTAIDHADRLYEKANRGDYVAIAAPGVNILAPAPDGTYGVSSGTSMAAAHVSGIVALALEVNPRLTPQGVRDLVVTTAHDLGPAGRDDEFGAGKANALDALTALSGPDATRYAGGAAVVVPAVSKEPEVPRAINQ